MEEKKSVTLREFFARTTLTIVSSFILIILLEMALSWVFFQQRHTTEKFAIQYYTARLRDKLKKRNIFQIITNNKIGGKDLNKLAWEASYMERGLTPDSPGPREGYWGSKLQPKVKVPGLRWIEPELEIPNRVSIDEDGFQVVGDLDADFKILILGGSVAGGAYASTIQNTYFSKLYYNLKKSNINTCIYILAAGAWVSHDQVAALALRGLDKNPNLVVFLDGGLSDLAAVDDNYERRVADYLSNMKRAKELTVSRNSRVVPVLIPSLVLKEQKTEIEKRLLDLSHYPPNLEELYEKILRGLGELSDKHLDFVDCSSALSKEKYITFADQWHFSDIGHELLAQCMADALTQIIPKLQN